MITMMEEDVDADSFSKHTGNMMGMLVLMTMINIIDHDDHKHDLMTMIIDHDNYDDGR